MYQKILVPLDKSKEAEGVLRMVEEQLVPGGEVILLTIIPPEDTRFYGETVFSVSQLEEIYRSKAMEYLRTVSESLADASMRSRCEVIISSSVVYAIVKFAELEKADLIMMYTHDRKGLAKLIKGST